jgi:hypothetical protein
MVSLRRYLGLIISVAVVAGLVGAGYAKYRYIYPFGHNHCCDKQLHFALHDFADNNDGNFPAGEASPEASLSLVQSTSELSYAYLLCGKTGSQSVAQEILDQGKLLGPDTCGWNYVEGLRIDDDHRLAILWDKEGLGHNSERLEGGGHIVTFVGGNSDHILEKEWDVFLGEQAELFAQRKNAQQNK